MTAPTLLFLAASLVLAYTGFCRLVRTDLRTVLCIRVVFWVLTAVSLVSAAESDRVDINRSFPVTPIFFLEFFNFIFYNIHQKLNC